MRDDGPTPRDDASEPVPERNPYGVPTQPPHANAAQPPYADPAQPPHAEPAQPPHVGPAQPPFVQPGPPPGVPPGGYVVGVSPQPGVPLHAAPLARAAVYESRVGGWWYYVVTILSSGFLTWVPLLHAAIRLRTTSARVLCALFSALNALMYVLVITAPRDTLDGLEETAGTNALGLATLISVVGGLIALARLRRRPYTFVPVALTPAPAPRQPEADPAIAAVLAARKRREAARELIENDPLMARELRIGRPDVDRDYDDGGLVDLGAAPAQAIADTCDVPLDTAELIVQAREARLEAFFNVDELLIGADIPVTHWDRIRDRGVLIP